MTLEITKGPSKLDLIQALFLSSNDHRHTVNFTLEDGRTFEVWLISAEAEDSSGESWNLIGLVQGKVAFKAYYRSDRRTGVTGGSSHKKPQFPPY